VGKKMIGAVLFDLEGTWLDRDASVYSFVQSQYQRFRNTLVHVQEETYNSLFIASGERHSSGTECWD